MLTLTRALDMDQQPLPPPPSSQYCCDDPPCRKPYPKSIPSLLRARAHKFSPDVADLLGLDTDALLISNSPSGHDTDVWAKISMLGKTGPPPPPPPPPPDAVIPKAP